MIAFNNNVGVWSSLEEAWEAYAEENNFGNGYSKKKTRLDTAPKVGEETQQVEYLPDDRFGVLGEIEDDDSDDEDGYGKRAMDGNHRLPCVSTDYHEVGNTTLLDQIEDTFGPIREW